VGVWRMMRRRYPWKEIDERSSRVTRENNNI